jgi:hypothetical protein
VSRMLLAFVAAALAAACAAPQWQNVDASRNTRAAFNWDQDDCRRASLYRNAHLRWGENPLFPYLVVDEERAAQCMKARGWQPTRSD